MMKDTSFFIRVIAKLKRIAKKPPHIILVRIIQECMAFYDAYFLPRKANKFQLIDLLKKMNVSSNEELWEILSSRTNLIDLHFDKNFLEKHFSDNSSHITKMAKNAMQYKVDLLGSGLINLGEKINWQCDYKTGKVWPNMYFRKIEYRNPDLPSDVKFPWELSRMQWVIPVGQMYLITQDDRYALFVKNLLLDWFKNNPFACSVNWACTMEVAMRIFTWCWFFEVFNASKSWQDKEFQALFLRNLYLHAEFNERYLESSDINGNHFTADAAAMVVSGIFFEGSKQAKKWEDKGWRLLTVEFPKQVLQDGVDFEASIPYHRLVLELFLFAAIYREKRGRLVERNYKNLLVKMAFYTLYYSRRDGSVPLLGDADDARVLPFGEQKINDHYYLIHLVGYFCQNNELLKHLSEPYSEAYWMFGECVMSVIGSEPIPKLSSRAFADSGYYILRDQRNHVFVDAAPIGQKGRGGHGHNDCLSFSAVIDGEELITDSGAYLYTASYRERNLFRSTAYHNTPQVDQKEINRFIAWDHLWTLYNDARPNIYSWNTNQQATTLHASHHGYHYLKHPVKVIRKLSLNHSDSILSIHDSFEGEGQHVFNIPLHLARNVKIKNQKKNKVYLVAGRKEFIVSFESEKWELSIEKAFVSPSYGVKHEIQKLVLSHKGKADKLSSKVYVYPRLSEIDFSSM